MKTAMERRLPAEVVLGRELLEAFGMSSVACQALGGPDGFSVIQASTTRREFQKVNLLASKNHGQQHNRRKPSRRSHGM
jgi:hypothetical protein